MFFYDMIDDLQRHWVGDVDPRDGPVHLVQLWRAVVSLSSTQLSSTQLSGNTNLGTPIWAKSEPVLSEGLFYHVDVFLSHYCTTVLTSMVATPMDHDIDRDLEAQQNLSQPCGVPSIFLVSSHVVRIANGSQR